MLESANMAKKTDKNIITGRCVNTLALDQEGGEGCLCGKASVDLSKMVSQNEFRLVHGGRWRKTPSGQPLPGGQRAVLASTHCAHG